MTYAATAQWLRERLWFGYIIGGVAWLVWIGNLALGGWYKDNEGTLLGADHLAFYTPARGRELDPASVKRGFTVAALYGIQHGFLDMTVGIRHEDPTSLKVRIHRASTSCSPNACADSTRSFPFPFRVCSA